MAPNILFSIIIPTRHRLPLLQRAIESINIQDYGNLEIIVIDNASDEPLTKHDISTNHSLTIIRNSTQLSASANRNLGARHAAGNIITFLDDDDELLPGKFSAHAEAFAKHPEAEFVYSNTRHIGPKNETLTISSGPPEMTPFLKFRYIHLNAFSVKKYIFDTMSFNEDMQSFGDVEFVGRLLRRGKAVHVPKLHAIWYRDNRDDQITRKNWRRSYKNWRILCDQFNEEIMADRSLRHLYHRKMFILSVMFFDTRQAIQSFPKTI